MAARHYQDLLVWQLASEVRAQVHLWTNSPGFERQFWLQSQLRRAAQSACANVAEGFGRFKPKDFARFVRNARGSLDNLYIKNGFVFFSFPIVVSPPCPE